MWIQERACHVLGNRRYEPAARRLGAVARDGTANGEGAALRALGRIGTRAALDQVLQSLSRFDKGQHYASADALQQCGCEVRKENVDPKGVRTPDYVYRLPDETEWRRL